MAVSGSKLRDRSAYSKTLRDQAQKSRSRSAKRVDSAAPDLLSTTAPSDESPVPTAVADGAPARLRLGGRFAAPKRAKSVGARAALIAQPPLHGEGQLATLSPTLFMCFVPPCFHVRAFSF
jgi:hypothetical protein